MTRDGLRVIDAHQHFWDPQRVDYPWLAPYYPGLNRAFGFQDLAPLLASSGVDATVVVQSADSAEDTAAMFEIADHHPQVTGVVAWAPLDEPPRAERMLEEVRRHRRFAGIRVLMHTRPDPDWILGAEVGSSLSMLEQAGAPFDFVSVLPRHLEHVPVLCERHPGLTIVIDHLAKPPVGGPDLEPWASLLGRAAESPNVYAKVSGLYPAGDRPEEWAISDLRPLLHHALELFGASRLMFGSDWPVCELAGGYERVTGALFALFDELADHERAALLSGTASAVYHLSGTSL